MPGVPICSLLDQGPYVWPLQGSRREGTEVRREGTEVRKAVGWWVPLSHWGDLFEGEAGLEPRVGKSERWMRNHSPACGRGLPWL